EPGGAPGGGGGGPGRPGAAHRPSGGGARAPAAEAAHHPAPLHPGAGAAGPRGHPAGRGGADAPHPGGGGLAEGGGLGADPAPGGVGPGLVCGPHRLAGWGGKRRVRRGLAFRPPAGRAGRPFCRLRHHGRLPARRGVPGVAGEPAAHAGRAGGGEPVIQLEPSHPPAGSPDATAQYLGALMDGLAGGGLRHLVFCPGSRSTPVLLAAHRHGGLRLWQHVDERSAAFFALGMAKVLAEPVAVLATSGTAAANFLPAVVEARYSRAPLILLTADRPRELRDVGAAQTIDQVNLYGSHVKWAVDLPLPEASPRLLRHALATGCRAAALAREGPPGPVHLNLPLREPLIPRELLEAGGRVERGLQGAGRAGDGEGTGPGAVQVRTGQPVLDEETVAALAQELRQVERGVVVVGPQEDGALFKPLLRLAGALGWPI